MKRSRMCEIALLLQEWRLRNLRSFFYMVELQVAAEELGISEPEMREFCINIFGRCITRLEQKKGDTHA